MLQVFVCHVVLCTCLAMVTPCANANYIYEILPVELPDAEKIEKIESRRHISYIWIARDNRVMIDDAIVEVKDVSKVMYKKRIDDPQIIVSLKIDKDTEMERVIQVQEELRLADATRINYATDFKAT